jgi:hypothetical protein
MSTPDDRPLGISLLIWLYWFWAGATVLLLLGLGIGEGPVPIGGRTVPRSEALALVLPVLLPLGLAVLGGAMALSTRRPWARPAALLPMILAGFGPALSGVGTTLADSLIGGLILAPFLAVLAWYLYFRPGTVAYFEGLKVGDGGPG